MGGALAQWYFKYEKDDLPAAVLVASWPSHQLAGKEGSRLLRLDPLGILLATLTGSTRPMIRSSKQSAALFLSPKSVYTPEELHSKLNTESLWTMYQHNPPLWQPPTQVKTPMLWIAGEIDAGISVEAERKSAEHYHADIVVAASAAHNIMMEHNYRETAETIHNWLIKRGVK
jgi:pimeloyl-ACP methyl ester carboxylesterase